MTLRARPITLISAAVAAGVIALAPGVAAAAPGGGGTGSITVYKLEQPSDSPGSADGSDLDVSGAKGLTADFTACSIDEINLRTTADWNKVAKVTATNVENAQPLVKLGSDTLSLTCGPSQTTDSSGKTTFSNLTADRAYVVYESKPPVNALRRVQPTVLTVPFPGAEGKDSAWNYSPVIYPKNYIVGSDATKDGVMVGNKATFTIKVPIKPLAEGEHYSEFKITDQLSKALRYSGAQVKIVPKGGSDVTLDPTEYQLSGKSGTTGAKVELAVTGNGLAKLDANVDGTVVLTINAEAVDTGSTANKATVTVNGTSTDDKASPEVKHPEPFFKGAHIYKEAVNKDKSKAPLAGAKFDVYPAKSSEQCPEAPAESATPVLSGQTSDANGETPETVLAQGRYCVYETVTPAGYKGLKGGMIWDVSESSTTLTVENTQFGADAGDLPSLPLTGSAGIVTMVIGGGLLIGLGIVLTVTGRRRQEKQESV